MDSAEKDKTKKASSKSTFKFSLKLGEGTVTISEFDRQAQQRKKKDSISSSSKFIKKPYRKPVTEKKAFVELTPALNFEPKFIAERKDRPPKWEYKWVRINNVLDHNPDCYVKKWVCEAQTTEQSSATCYKLHVCKLEDCGKAFYDINALKKHMLTHGERQYICEEEGCGKKFLDNSKLRRHKLVHTGERPYKCEICEKQFSLDFNLRTHLRTHTGEKPYVCKFPGCGKRFTQSSNLTAHEKGHFQREGEEIVDEENPNGGVNQPESLGNVENVDSGVNEGNFQEKLNNEDDKEQEEGEMEIEEIRDPNIQMKLEESE